MRGLSTALLVAVVGLGCQGAAERPYLALRVLYPLGGKGDLGFADSVSAAVDFGRWQFELELEEYEPADAAAAASQFDEWLANPAPSQLVVTVGAPYDELVSARGCDFGASRVLHLDATLEECGGLRSVGFRTYEPSFEAGAAVIALSPDKRVGAIGGADIPAVRELLEGFRDGALSAGGTVAPFAFIADDESGFDDESGAELLAAEMFDDVDVILAASGGSTLGIIRAAAAREGAYVVGADADWALVASEVVAASVLKRLDIVLRDTMFAAADGSFVSGAVTVGQDSGATELLVNSGFRSTFQ